MSTGSVVVVDDNGVNRMLLSGILEQAGYVVRAVSNGRDALQMIELEPPDIILLDIQMPKMSGYEVCEALKAMQRTREVPVIFISAVEDIAEKVRAFETGGVDYITKPFEPAEVLARVGTQVKLFATIDVDSNGEFTALFSGATRNTDPNRCTPACPSTRFSQTG